MRGYGDIRVAARADWLLERLVATGSCVIRKLGGTRAGEMAVHRFLSSPHSETAAILDTLGARTAEACAGRHIVCVQDTSEINFRGREAARRGLGPGGDGKSAAFFMHPLLAVEAEGEAVLGLLGADIWTRAAGKVGDRRRRLPQQKESRRWLDGALRAGQLLRGRAASVTVVGDRESDVYTLFAQRPADVELVLRVAQDRALEEGGRLFAALARTPAQAQQQVEVAPRGPGDKGRTATLELRACRVQIARPKRLGLEQAPASVEMTLVEAREPAPPEGCKPLHWRLLSSAELSPARVVALYRLRWRIEQLFRSVKSDGLKLEQTQLHDAERLIKLAALALGAAARIMQLVDARDGSERPLSDVLDPCLAPALKAISQSLEGNTERQKNPFPPDSLAFLAWVTARLGGWNCYYKPPGPKTMRSGWNTLAAQLAGYTLAKDLENV